MSVIDNVKDTIRGVFSGTSPDPITDSPNTPEQQKLFEMVYQDYQIFREKRQEIEAIWQQEDRFYEGGKRHWEGLRSEDTMKDRPNSVDNIAYSQVESIVSALTAWHPEGTFEVMEPHDEQKAQELTAYMPYELRAIKFKPKHIKAVRRMVNHGMLLYKTVYDPTIEGGRGNNRFIGQNDIIPLEYGSFFPDPRIVDFIYLQQGRAHIINTVRDIEYFKDRWPEQGAKVQESNYSSDVEIFDTDKDVQPYKSRRTNLLEYWYKGKPKMMTKEDKKVFEDLAKEAQMEGKDPSVYQAKAAGTTSGIHCIYISIDGVFLEHKSYVYDHGQYPIVARALFPVEGSIWPKGYMRDLISPQIMLNKFSELAVETAAKMGNGAIIYEEGAIAESKKGLWKRLRSTVGAMLPVTNIAGVKETQGIAINPTHLSMMQHFLMMLQKIPRRFDSSNGGANFSGESGKHAEALQSASAGHLSTATELIQDALEEVYQQYIELIAQFYTTERVGRVTGKQVSMNRDKLLSQAQTEQPHTDANGQPTGQMLVEEYVPVFDIKVTIGTERPTDREYWVRTAFTLLQTLDPLTQQPLIDAKAVIYAVDNGRLEPFDVIQERTQRDQMIAQHLQQQEQQIQQMGAQMQQLTQALGQSQQQNTAAHADMLKHQNDAQKMAFDQHIQDRKTSVDELKAVSQLQNGGGM